MARASGSLANWLHSLASSSGASAVVGWLGSYLNLIAPYRPPPLVVVARHRKPFSCSVTYCLPHQNPFASTVLSFLIHLAALTSETPPSIPLPISADPLAPLSRRPPLLNAHSTLPPLRSRLEPLSFSVCSVVGFQDDVPFCSCGQVWTRFDFPINKFLDMLHEFPARLICVTQFGTTLPLAESFACKLNSRD